jgi:methylthioribose-1-phosphate isomerase
MKVKDKHYRSIWVKDNNHQVIQIIDQRYLPHQFVIEDLTTVTEMAIAIKEMHLRGAGVIGAAGAYGMYLAALHASRTSLTKFTDDLNIAAEQLKNTRPTAINLEWAVNRQMKAIASVENDLDLKVTTAFKTAQMISNEDAQFCKQIGEHGVSLIKEISQVKQNKTVNILTHCNAGWLACVDYGTATAPIYEAHAQGIKVHVWVDETRPRNQGARLTAWELGEQGVPHTVIADNVGGHLMQHGLVDLVITGSDRTTYTGDVANKIGTYLKALAAKDNNIPFYVALGSSAFDWRIADGIKEIPIEERDPREVKYIRGLSRGEIQEVLLTPESSSATNYGFDVTPARLISGLITERGICQASPESIFALYPEKKETIALLD